MGRGLLAAPSSDLEDALTGLLRIRDEQGLEIFYNFAVTPWSSLGADLQVIKPVLVRRNGRKTGKKIMKVSLSGQVPASKTKVRWSPPLLAYTLGAIQPLSCI